MATEQNENNDMNTSDEKETKEEEHNSFSADDPKEGTSSQDEPKQHSPTARPTTPEACSICLGKVENKSFTDSCFHTFCFVCLMEWSKVKAVCPLCKQPFKSIIHNVRSFEDYDQYDLKNNSAADADAMDSSARFRYRTTLTSQRWLARQIREQERQLDLLQRPSRTTTRSHWRTRHQAATAAFRKTVYNTGMRVTDVRTACGRPMRYRQITPAFFARNSACTHRLVPWLNRELNVLLHNHEDNVTFLLELILDLIKRFDIQSEEFAEHIRSFTGRRTEQFVHELYMFARSPYDMVAYDEHAVYDVTNENTETHEISSSSNSSPSSSIVALDRSSIVAIDRSSAVDDSVIVLNSDDDEVEIQDVAGPSNRDYRPGDAMFGYQLRYMSPMPLLGRVRNFLSSITTESDTGMSSWDDPPVEITIDNDLSSPVPTFPPTNAVVYIAEEEQTNRNFDKNTIDISQPSTSGNKNSADISSPGPSTSKTGIFVSTVQSDGPTDENDGHEAAENGRVDTMTVKHEKQSSVSDWENGSDIVIVGYDKPWEERSPIPLSSAEEEIFVTKTKPATPNKRKATLKSNKKSRSRSRSSSSSSLSSSSLSSTAKRRRKKKKKHRSRSRSTVRSYTSSRYRRRSRSHSPSAFGDHRRRRRRSKSVRSSKSRHKGSRRSKSKSRSRRSRSRLHRYSRSISRSRRISRSISRTRRVSPSRYSRSPVARRQGFFPRRSRSPIRFIRTPPRRRHSRSISRSTGGYYPSRRRSNSRRRSISPSDRRRCSRSPMRRRRNSRTYSPMDKRRRSRSFSPLDKRNKRKSRTRDRSSSLDVIEYTALGRYFDKDGGYDDTSKRPKKKQNSSAYTSEWVHSSNRHRKRDSSVETVNSNISAFQYHSKKKRSERTDSIEVVGEHRNGEDYGSSISKRYKSKKHKHKQKDSDDKSRRREASRSVAVLNGGSSVDYRTSETNRSDTGAHFKKHPTGHKKSSK